jgi:hypothetical protein
VPGVAPFQCARILQALELQTLFGQAKSSTVGQETIAIRRDHVRHRSALPYVAVEPESTIHCVDHTLAAAGELAREQRLSGDVGHRRP